MSEISSESHPVAGDQAILADRYVGALFSLAEQDGLIDAVIEDMKSLRQLWGGSAEWRQIATDPRLTRKEVVMAASAVGKEAEVSGLTANFLMVLAQNRRLSLLPMLIERFVDEVDSRRGEFRATVRTAHTLTEAQHDRLASSLTSAMGGKVRLSVVEDPSIIGGLTVKIGSRLVDASVKSKLDRLERTLKGTCAAV
ncbi:MAG: F0F1 ATP synthase subunit delta [Alphaproteobacteria bacterium]|nr:F0F1 ATP synthase subunit delta [Alphaproteobacteria bacterium]